MANALDLVGQRFGKLVVIERAENNKRGNTQWLCQCDCGNTKIALGYDLTHHRTVSCGCNPMGKISPKRINLVGEKFGKLTVIALNEEKSKKGILVWDCQCDCGNKISVRGGNLKNGHSKSCGCLDEHSYNFIDLTGKRFGRLEVISLSKKGKQPLWLCQCDCGKQKIVNGNNLRTGKTTSCGCLVKEISKRRLQDNNFYKDRINKRNKTHGMSYTRLYREWVSMKNRCNPSYHERKNYYDKGIEVCSEWMDFSVFKKWAVNNGYSENLTLDRIENSKGYSPENCRWVDMKAQENNRLNNIKITRNGKTQTLKQWCEELNLNYGMVKHRYQMGWSEERLFEPKHKNQYQ